MTKDEMKNRISMTLKDPILQQGFEIICKNLSDLEKENAELKKEVEKHKWNDIFLEDCTDYDKKIAEEYTTLQERIAELEKENAELKGKLKTAYRKGMRHMAKALKYYDRTDGAWTDYFEHTVDKVLQREQLDFEKYGTLAEQLTKAKEIIRMVIDSYKHKERFSFEKDLKKAEQFLNSEVEK